MKMRFIFAATLTLSLFNACSNEKQPNLSATNSKEDKAESKTVVLSGVIQYESPCVRADFPNGCLRLLTDKNLPGGNLKYIDQPEQDNAHAEFNIVNDLGTTFYRLWYKGTSSILLAQNQKVEMTVELDEMQTTITKIHSIAPSNAVILKGIIQYESPCVVAGFPNGCLRLVTDDKNLPGGDLKYIDRPEKDNAGAEFYKKGNTIYLWLSDTNGTNSVRLEHNKPVSMTVELNEKQTTITKIITVETFPVAE